MTANVITDAIQQEMMEIDRAEADAGRRKLREETMANVCSTIYGLTERMLQLPDLGCEIPEKLSVFATPIVIPRLIDAGIMLAAMVPWSSQSTQPQISITARDPQKRTQNYKLTNNPYTRIE